MAVIVATGDAQGLLSAFVTSILREHVETWELTSDKRLTHTTHDNQWYRKAFFRPNVASGQLQFIIERGDDGEPISDVVFGVYHGRLIESLLSHYKRKIDSAQVAYVMGDQA